MFKMIVDRVERSTVHLGSRPVERSWREETNKTNRASMTGQSSRGGWSIFYRFLPISIQLQRLFALPTQTRPCLQSDS